MIISDSNIAKRATIIIFLFFVICSICFISVKLGTNITMGVNLKSIVALVCFLILFPFLFIKKIRLVIFFVLLLALPGTIDDFLPQIPIGYEFENGFNTFTIISFFDIFFLLFLILIKKDKKNYQQIKVLNNILTFLVISTFFSFCFALPESNDYEYGALLKGTFMIVRLIIVYIFLKNVNVDNNFYINIIYSSMISSILLSVGSIVISSISGSERLQGGSYGNNIFANFLVLLTLIILGGINSKSIKKKIKPLVILTIGLNIIVIFFTGTRMALIALLIGIIIYVMIQKNKMWVKIVILSHLFFLLIYVTNTGVFENSRFSVLLNPLEFISQIDKSTSTTVGTRLIIWDATFDMIKDRPFFGVGPGIWNYERYNYGIYFNVLLDPHNGYLGLLSEYGLVFFVFYLSFIFIALFKILKHIRYYKKYDLESYKLLLSYCIGVICWMITEMSNAGIYKVQIQYFFWIIIMSFYFYIYNKPLDYSSNKYLDNKHS